jgi:hypothetical protein
MKLLATFFMMVSYPAYSSTLKKEAICSSKTSVDFYRTIERHIPEEEDFLVKE